MSKYANKHVKMGLNYFESAINHTQSVDFSKYFVIYRKGSFQGSFLINEVLNLHELSAILS